MTAAVEWRAEEVSQVVGVMPVHGSSILVLMASIVSSLSPHLVLPRTVRVFSRPQVLKIK